MFLLQGNFPQILSPQLEEGYFMMYCYGTLFCLEDSYQLQWNNALCSYLFDVSLHPSLASKLQRKGAMSVLCIAVFLVPNMVPGIQESFSQYLLDECLSWDLKVLRRSGNSMCKEQPVAWNSLECKKTEKLGVGGGIRELSKGWSWRQIVRVLESHVIFYTQVLKYI